MHLGFVFLHQKVYDFGRLHLLLSLWPCQTVKENQAGRALHKPSSGATVIRKTVFIATSVAAVLSLLLISLSITSKFAPFAWLWRFYMVTTEEFDNILGKKSRSMSSSMGTCSTLGTTTCSMTDLQKRNTTQAPSGAPCALFFKGCFFLPIGASLCSAWQEANRVLLSEWSSIAAQNIAWKNGWTKDCIAHHWFLSKGKLITLCHWPKHKQTKT